MTSAVELLPFLLLGALGSLHCVAMCGGFALLVAAPRARGWRPALGRQACYAIGKASTYGLLALLLASGVAMLGAAVGDPAPARGPAAGRLGSLFSALAGLVLVWTGAATLLRWRLPAPGRWSAWALAWTRPARALLAQAEALPGSARAFAIGVLNGLLPCGLSWAALLAAARLAPVEAAAAGLVFGLATTPALAALGLGSALVGARARRAVPAVLGTLLIAFGLATLLRGAGRAPGASSAAPRCCEAQVLAPASAALHDPERAGLPANECVDRPGDGGHVAHLRAD